MQELTQSRLKEVLDYDPKTGYFTWLAGGKMSGKPAGSVSDHGYVVIGVNSKRYKAHRLAWLYVYGSMPISDLDHANGVRADNRISNLRACTDSENHFNIGAMRTNTSGFKGVFWHKRAGKWLAQIGVNGKDKFLGLFPTAELAFEAYSAKAKQLHGNFYRGFAA